VGKHALGDLGSVHRMAFVHQVDIEPPVRALPDAPKLDAGPVSMSSLRLFRRPNDERDEAGHSPTLDGDQPAVGRVLEALFQNVLGPRRPLLVQGLPFADEPKPIGNPLVLRLDAGGLADGFRRTSRVGRSSERRLDLPWAGM
jgi:hypothetical protein